MESPTLAIMTPLLLRGLRERSTPVKRKTAIIIDNMAKVSYPLCCGRKASISKFQLSSAFRGNLQCKPCVMKQSFFG